MREVATSMFTSASSSDFLTSLSAVSMLFSVIVFLPVSLLQAQVRPPPTTLPDLLRVSSSRPVSWSNTILVFVSAGRPRCWTIEVTILPPEATKAVRRVSARQ
eukprot:758329-Hanusia_phi.AAC.1